MSKQVALVLASGGARGLAHIGAIEELQSRGYEITSVAGCSAGALIAGIFAAGKLEEAKEWFMNLDRQKLLQLGDFNLSRNYLMRGDKIVEAFKEIVPDSPMEDLPIPVSVVASDVIHNREVVIETGSLFEAVRASVSIPIFFRPVKKDDMLLVDGGILNACPLNRVRRREGDILAAMNISAPDTMEVEHKEVYKPKFLSDFPAVERFLDEHFGTTEEEDMRNSLTYTSLLSRMTDMMIQNNTVLMNRLVPADILAEMPMNQYPTFAFDKADEIIELGRTLMKQAIDRYEEHSIHH